MTEVLFFSRGVSLKLWLDKGLFDREKLLYEEHLNKGTLKRVYWLTYGSSDLGLSESLKKEGKLHSEIIILPMPKLFNIPKIGSYLYSFYIPLLYKKELQDSDIYKTNQTDGSWSAVISKKFYGKKLLYRTGFTMSQLENKLKRFNSLVRSVIESAESFAYKNCDKAVVASNHNFEYVIDKYSVKKEKLEVIYNFIDRSKFYDFQGDRERKIVFVGRLSDEKNIFNLIESLKDKDISIDIYGSGPLKNELAEFIFENGFNVKLKGNIANNELPKVINSAKYFTLVSKHEGMPKALIEGMACGSICIGTNVSGINEVIKEGVGVLADDISVNALSKAFDKAFNLSIDEEQTLKQNSANYIDDNFTLESVVQKEEKIFKELMNG